MNKLLKHIFRFVFFILVQGLIVGQLDLGQGVHVMIYPLYLILLPFDIRPIPLLLIGFFLGISIDFFMNTFGLHASAAVLVAFIRPMVFRRFAPRDGYDTIKEPTATEWGYGWFFKVSGVIVLIHHFWFFILEYFKLSAFKEIIYNSMLSAGITIIIFIFIQMVFFKKPKSV